MQGGYWYTSARSARLLEDPRGDRPHRRRRALRHLGARKVKTQQAPLVFSPEIARGLIGNIFSAAEGDAIYRNASIFNGMLGERVAGDNITVVDDGTLVFDRHPSTPVISTEGAERRSGETPVFAPAQPIAEALSPFASVASAPPRSTARGCPHAARSLSSVASCAATSPTPTPDGARHPFHRQRLTRSGRQPRHGLRQLLPRNRHSDPEEIIASVPNGLYVTEVMGFGVNLVPATTPRRERPVDRRRRAQLPGRRDHHRRQPQRHLSQHQCSRQRPALPRLRRCAHAASGRHDDRRGIVAPGPHADFPDLMRYVSESYRWSSYAEVAKCAVRGLNATL